MVRQEDLDQLRQQQQEEEREQGPSFPVNRYAVLRLMCLITELEADVQAATELLDLRRQCLLLSGAELLAKAHEAARDAGAGCPSGSIWSWTQFLLRLQCSNLITIEKAGGDPLAFCELSDRLEADHPRFEINSHFDLLHRAARRNVAAITLEWLLDRVGGVEQLRQLAGGRAGLGPGG